jgi:hypothetical protein
MLAGEVRALKQEAPPATADAKTEGDAAAISGHTAREATPRAEHAVTSAIKRG